MIHHLFIFLSASLLCSLPFSVATSRMATFLYSYYERASQHPLQACRWKQFAFSLCVCVGTLPSIVSIPGPSILTMRYKRPLTYHFFIFSFTSFQDYFSSHETDQSFGGRKRENPEKKHLAHPQAKLCLFQCGATTFSS